MSRKLPPAKQYLAPDNIEGPIPCFGRAKSDGTSEIVWLLPEMNHRRAVLAMAKLQQVWAYNEGDGAGGIPPRWDMDETYFAPSGKGNQLREYRLPRLGRKSIRGKTLPTTDDLLSLI